MYLVGMENPTDIFAGPPTTAIGKCPVKLMEAERAFFNLNPYGIIEEFVPTYNAIFYSPLHCICFVFYLILSPESV